MGASIGEDANPGRDTRLRNILDAVLGSAPSYRDILLFDESGRVLYVTAGAARFLGSAPDKLVGRGLDDVVTAIDQIKLLSGLMDRATRDGRATCLWEREVPTGGTNPLGFTARTFEIDDETLMLVEVHDTAGSILGNPSRGEDEDGTTGEEVPATQELEMLRAIISGSEDAIFAKDTSGRYILANEACVDLFGRPMQEILGRDDLELHEPKLARLTIERDRRILAGEGPERYEVVDQSTPRGERIYHVAKWAHADRGGRIIALVGVARDVTEARDREAALRRSEEQYRLLAENSTDLISRHDPEGNYLYVSPSCRRVMGYAPEALVRRSAYDFIHPDDLQNVRAVHERLLHSNEPMGVEFRLLRPDGSSVWVETLSRVVRDPHDDQILEIHCSTRDVSDRRLAEDELRSSRGLLHAILENSSAVIYAKDLEGRYILMNRWFEETFSVRREDLLGLTDHEIFPEALADAFRANDLRALEAGGPVEFEEIAPGPDGNRVYISIKCPILDLLGEPRAVCGISTEITDRKRFEDQLRLKNARLEDAMNSERLAHLALKRAESQLVEAEKLSSLGQMVAGVAHEINNPLSYAINNIAVLRRDLSLLGDLVAMYREGEELIREHAPDLSTRVVEHIQSMDLNYTMENLDELVRRAEEGLDRIRRIVRDLRAFARPGEDGLHVVDLNDGVASTVNLVHGPARDRGVELVLDLEALPPLVCQSNRIHQVILNLLLNALDASKAGGRITVRTRSEGGDVVIDIIDEGSGIDPAIRPKIFDPFFTTKGIGKGTGLGLSISYGIIRDHGGRIEVDSTLGRGSRFTIVLPVERPTPSAGS